MSKTLKIGVMGIDHGHIFDMLDEILKEGCVCEKWWTDGYPLTLEEFNKKYPKIKRVDDKLKILEDQSIDLILISSIPKDRASIAIQAMNAGKDVMVDKPGCTTINQLNKLKECVKKTGKIWSVNFSERFHVSAVAKAEELVKEKKIGNIKQTIGTGPHRLGNYERPDVEKIEGLSPVIAIEQKTTSKNPRSTVGTVTDIYDFIRLLFARIGVAYSYKSNLKMVKNT